MCGESLVHDVNKLTVVAGEGYAGFVADLQSKIREDLYERPTKASKEYFAGKTIFAGDDTQAAHTVSEEEAGWIYNYLVKNDYIDDDGAVTNTYHGLIGEGRFVPLREELATYSSGIHKLVQAISDPGIVGDMIVNGHDTRLKGNPLNDNFFKKEFQELWGRINARYAYTVEFDSPELIAKSAAALNAGLRVSELKYVLTEGVQEGAEFAVSRTMTRKLEHAHGSRVLYDLVGKIAAGTMLTRRSVAAILKGLSREKLHMFRLNPEEFIQGAIKEINSQKANVVVEHIAYQPSAEEPYTQDIFNMSKSSQEYARAYRAKKAVQDYVFTDGTAAMSVERRFAEDVDVADEVIVYAKLPAGPKGFHIPTPVGNYSPDWAIAFRRGSVKHMFFIAETKGTMDSTELRPVERAKIACAKKLFNEISTAGVKYHEVDSYQKLLDVMRGL